MSDEKRVFSYNKGVVNQPNITLNKVTHIDLDSLIAGVESEIIFVTPTDEGFCYLKDIKDAVKAYEAESLYVVSGNY